MITVHQFYTLRKLSIAARKIDDEDKSHHLYVQFKDGRVRYALRGSHISAITPWVQATVPELKHEEGGWCVKNAFDDGSKLAEILGSRYEITVDPLSTYGVACIPCRLPNLDKVFSPDDSITSRYTGKHIRILRDIAKAIYKHHAPSYTFKPGLIYSSIQESPLQISLVDEYVESHFSRALSHFAMDVLCSHISKDVDVELTEGRPPLFHLEDVSIAFAVATDTEPKSRLTRNFDTPCFIFENAAYIEPSSGDNPTEVVAFINCVADKNFSKATLHVRGYSIPPTEGFGDPDDWDDEMLNLELKIRAGRL